MITAEDVQNEIDGMKDSIAQEIADHPEEGPIPAYVMPIFEAGHWLGKKLEAAGATEKEREDACFAMGQRACMAGAPRAYEVAASCFNNWVAGRKDQPGRALAEALIEGNA